MFQGVDSSDTRCRLSDVILPAQSYLSHVVGSVAVCTTEACLDKYRQLVSSFAEGNVAGDPLAHVDSFGKVNFQKALISAQKALREKPWATSRSPASSVSSGGGRTRIRSPGKNKKEGSLELPLSLKRLLPVKTCCREALKIKCT